MYRVTKQFHFAMGHRLPKHKGACKNIHGHNYLLEVCVESETLDENGMVIDFKDLKEIVNEKVISELDHALMLKDTDLTETSSFKEVRVPFEPTAENMAKFIFDEIEPLLPENVNLHSVTIFETVGSFATYSKT